MFRWRSKKAVLARPEGLGHGQARHGHVQGQRGRARRGVLARRHAGSRWSPTRAAGRSSSTSPRRTTSCSTSAKPTAVRACKVAWRSDGEALVVVQADEGCQEEVGALVRLPIKNPKDAADRGRLQRRQPGLPAADARAVAMLCPSCRRQLDRGGGFCLSCGTPRPGHVAPLELVLGDRTRVPVVAEMVIGRAPGSTRGARRPDGLARARADLGQRRRHGRRSRTPAPATARGSTARGSTGRSSCATGSSSGSATRRCCVERRRDNTEAGRTIVVRPGASLVVPAMGRPGVTSQATQFGMRPRIRSGYALKRLEADEGRKRWVLKDLNTNTFLRLSRQRRADLRAARRHALAGGPDRRSPSSASGPPGRRGSRACSPTSASAASWPASRARRPRAATRRAARAAQAAVPPARSKTFDGVGPFYERALPARRAGCCSPSPALIALGRAGRGRARRVRLPDRRPLRHAVRRRVEDRPRRPRVPRRAASSWWRSTRRAHALAMASFGRKVDKAGLEAAVHLPLRVRGHLGGVVRAAPPPDRDLRRGPGVGLLDRRACSRCAACCSPRAPSATSSSTSRSPPTWARSSTSTRSSTATATRSSSTCCKEPGLRRRAKEQFSRKLSGKGNDAADSPVLARYSLFGLGVVVPGRRSSRSA